jgi:hypothetical protein
MAIRIWADLPAAERREDQSRWTKIPSPRRCQAATRSGHRHRTRATNDGLCYVHYNGADAETRARAKELSEEA